ncbi:Leukocyte immunoglobulin-like receptor subfamily A member 1 [Dissostichus eleginoides]|uniref:Leukocyte immunoglobulin-like receptor subfamily A member 1 n=1 Tax=Dissostichus eleginoides TaxID=100907 RepID=A0AAD9FJI6_DISEL|nr:Leukocyte immunoglobulin-like receptor subfamily A member 1 [Dissostichus eleginoides]
MAGRLLFVILMSLLPPTLTVNPPVITETDSVTLHCQTPPSVSVSQCYFYTLSGGTVRLFPCLKTLTGTELLQMSQQSSPAEVQVKCFYTVKHGGINSPESNVSSIIIQTPLPPTLTVNPPVITETDSVTLHCQTPPSVSVSQCNFYTLSGRIVRLFPCLKTLTGTELLQMSQQSSPAEVQVKCFYTVKYGGSTSPHSDTSSITIHNTLENESSTTQSIAPSKGTTGWTVVMSKNTRSSSSSSPTPVKAASAEIWKFVAVVAGCGVTVGVSLLVSAILCNNRRAGPDEVKRQDSKVENSDTYHMYCTIPEEPAASDLMMGKMYSTVQSH